MELLFRLFFLFICSAFCDMQASSFSFQKLDLPYEHEGNQFIPRAIDTENRIYGYIKDKDEKVASIFSYSPTGELSVTPLPSGIVLNEPVYMNDLGQIAGIYRRTITAWPGEKKRELQTLFLFDISGKFTDMGILSKGLNQELSDPAEPEFSIRSLNEKEQILLSDRQYRYAVRSNGTFIDVELNRASSLNNQNKIVGIKYLDSGFVVVLYDFETGQTTEIERDVGKETLFHLVLTDSNRVIYHKTYCSFEITPGQPGGVIFIQKNNIEKFMKKTYLWTRETRKIEKIKNLYPVAVSRRGHILAMEKNRDLKKSLSKYPTAFFLNSSDRNFNIENLNIERLILIENNGNKIDLSETLQNARESGWSGWSGWSFMSGSSALCYDFIMSDRDSIVGKGTFEGSPAYFLMTRNESD